MTLSEELLWRGFVNQTTFPDIKALDEMPRTFYWGVDPSASSMTIGNLAPAMMVRHFMNHGYTPILLVGGATGLIGDPDGKKQERDLQTTEEIQRNADGIAAQYRQIFNGQDFEIVNNYDWFKDMNYLDFLREIGKNVSLTQMLDRDFIKARIGEGGSGISYAEFSYALIQGFDFLHLFRNKGATLQIAGADQWGNSITGVDLIRRVEGGEAHVFTTPLIINKNTGVKFGKSEAGAVWLDPALTSPYRFYQFWLNIDDEFAKDLIKIYTMLSREEIEQVIAEHDQAPYERRLQRRLADEVTRIVHGEERLQSIKTILRVLFDGQGISELTDADMDALAREIPAVAAGVTITDALQTAVYADSNGAARRLIAGGGVKVNGEKIADENLLLAPKTLVKVGKNKFILVR